MANSTMGEVISTLRKEKGMTQKELAEKLNITDKAVSKWERDIACPDTTLIPKLADILGISIEELMAAKLAEPSGHRGAGYFMEISFPAIGLAMGIAVTVLSILDELDAKDGITMLGIGLACVSLRLLNLKR